MHCEINSNRKYVFQTIWYETNMKVTVATLSDTVFTLDVSDDLEIENFKVRYYS
jgi:hypothetical protein